MNVKLLAHTQLSKEFKEEIKQDAYEINDRAAIALSAIRCCYSPNKPSEIVSLEGEKYFGNKASDGKSGTEADRLFRQIVASKHVSTLEHLTYTFAIEGVSRALLAQLTRHRHLSFSVQSMRYCKMGSNDKIGGFDYVTPNTLEGKELSEMTNAEDIFNEAMRMAQAAYDQLRACGVPGEDARAVIPQAATTNIVMTGNLRTFLEFYNKRKPGKGAQYEITQLAEHIKSEILKVDEWLTPYFEEK